MKLKWYDVSRPSLRSTETRTSGFEFWILSTSRSWGWRTSRRDCAPIWGWGRPWDPCWSGWATSPCPMSEIPDYRANVATQTEYPSARLSSAVTSTAYCSGSLHGFVQPRPALEAPRSDCLDWPRAFFGSCEASSVVSLRKCLSGVFSHPGFCHFTLVCLDYLPDLRIRPFAFRMSALCCVICELGGNSCSRSPRTSAATPPSVYCNAIMYLLYLYFTS